MNVDLAMRSEGEVCSSWARTHTYTHAVAPFFHVPLFAKRELAPSILKLEGGLP